MSSSAIALPNPLTSLAWLTPTIAGQLEVARYLCCAVLGVSPFRDDVQFDPEAFLLVLGIPLGGPHVAPQRVQNVQRA